MSLQADDMQMILRGLEQQVVYIEGAKGNMSNIVSSIRVSTSLHYWQNLGARTDHLAFPGDLSLPSMPLLCNILPFIRCHPMA